jgi:hypothetical protein
MYSDVYMRWDLVTSSSQLEAASAMHAGLDSAKAQTAEHGRSGPPLACERAAQMRKHRLGATHRMRADAGAPQGRKAQVGGGYLHDEHDARTRLGAMALARARTVEVRSELHMATRMVDEGDVEGA